MSFQSFFVSLHRIIKTINKDNMNYEVVTKNILNGLKSYFEKNGIKTAVLGISGGIDSTVTAALCKICGIHLVGISMPCSTNKGDEVSAAKNVGSEFCDEFKEISIQNAFEAVSKLTDMASDMKETPISQGNIKARVRMITLYDIASKRRGIVLDTDNLTEHYLGFWTLKGDEGDFNPIGGLWKHEVYGLARYLNETYFGNSSEALNASIGLTPTDGNGVSNTDLDQIAPNKTYDDVDEILMAWVNLDPRIKKSVIDSGYTEGVFKELSEKHGNDIVSMVIQRSLNSEFKRKSRPFIIDIVNGNILEKNGNVMTN